MLRDGVSLKRHCSLPGQEGSLERLLVVETIAIIDEMWNRVPMARHGPWLADPQVRSLRLPCPNICIRRSPFITSSTSTTSSPTTAPPSLTSFPCPCLRSLSFHRKHRPALSREVRSWLTPPLPTAIFIIFLLSLSARFGSSSSPFLLPSPDPTLADVYAPPPQTHTHNIKTLNPNCLRHRFAHTVPARSWLTTFVDLIRDRAQFPPSPTVTICI